MLAIEFAFIGGRCHATPWGRHVNESDVGWPPDPWRIVRSLIAVWHRKLDPSHFPRERLASLLAKLASDTPLYWLPPAVHTHTRHYMPTIEGSNEKRTLVFDAYARIDRPLVVIWPGCSPTADELDLLDALLTNLGYLGRAESWVEARRVEADQSECNCLPGDEAIDPDTGELGDIVMLLLPKTPGEYAQFRAGALEDLAGIGKRERARLTATLPENWLDALAVETSQLQAAGWSAPPAASKRHYRRPAQSLVPSAPTPFSPLRTHTSRPTTARFVIYGKPLPRLEDTLRVGEWARFAVLGRAKWTLGEDRIPCVLSGHGLPEGNRHGHAFYLPEDSDGDGRIDHLLVHAPTGFAPDSVRVLEELTWMKDDAGQKLQLMLEGLGTPANFQPSVDLCGTSTVWESITPYLHPWHRKKHFGISDQLRRECAERGLMAELVLAEPLAPSPRALSFARFRRKRGLTQPDTRGSFWRIVFDRPVTGPLALGFGCHYGLGLFRPRAASVPASPTLASA